MASWIKPQLRWKALNREGCTTFWSQRRGINTNFWILFQSFQSSGHKYLLLLSANETWIISVYMLEWYNCGALTGKISESKVMKLPYLINVLWSGLADGMGHEWNDIGVDWEWRACTVVAVQFEWYLAWGGYIGTHFLVPVLHRYILSGNFLFFKKHRFSLLWPINSPNYLAPHEAHLCCCRFINEGEYIMSNRPTAFICEQPTPKQWSSIIFISSLYLLSPYLNNWMSSIISKSLWDGIQTYNTRLNSF